MKKLAVSTIIIALILALSLTLFACSSTPENTGEKSVAIIIGEDTYTLTTSKAYVHDALCELRDAQGVNYIFENGPYGVAIMELNELYTTADWTKCVGIYHTIDDVTIRDMSSYGAGFYWNDVLYYTSGVGVSSLPLVDGATYLFKQI